MPSSLPSIKPSYAQHRSRLELEAKVKGMSCANLDIRVKEVGTNSPLFQARGKYVFFANGVDVKAANGALLYRIRQKRLSRGKVYQVTDGGVAKDGASVLMQAQARRAMSDWTDLAIHCTPSDGRQPRPSMLKIRNSHDTIEVLTDNGLVLGQIIRSKSSLSRLRTAQSYRMLISPGVDASLVVLVFVCMHMQRLVRKSTMSTVAVTAAAA